MNIITIISTRPEIIRLSQTIKLLDNILGDNHILVHTGQNFSPTLHSTFFKDLGLRQPNHQFNIDEKKTGYDFGGYIMKEIADILKPYDTVFDRILILGDTNGAYYSAYVARKMGFKIYHAEAGNRCWDDGVPEEVNRKAIDSFSHKLLPYTQRSRENLLREGYHPKDINVIGNPMFEVMFETMGVEWMTKDKEKKDHTLVTFHRHENISDDWVIEEFINQLNTIKGPVIVSTHPSFKSKLDNIELKFNKNIKFLEPMSFKEFVELEATAKCVITDSGTVPEECAMFNVPCILLRNSTERPELLEVNQMLVAHPTDFITLYNKLELFAWYGLPQDYQIQSSQLITKLILGDV